MRYDRHAGRSPLRRCGPCPACYRRGGHATVTDCNVVLKRVQPTLFPRFGPAVMTRSTSRPHARAHRRRRRATRRRHTVEGSASTSQRVDGERRSRARVTSRSGPRAVALVRLAAPGLACVRSPMHSITGSCCTRWAGAVGLRNQARQSSALRRCSVEKRLDPAVGRRGRSRRFPDARGTAAPVSPRTSSSAATPRYGYRDPIRRSTSTGRRPIA